MDVRMNRNHRTWNSAIYLTCLLGGFALLCTCARLNAQTANQYPFQDPSRTFEERVNDLVSRMTLEEKVSQMQNGAAAIPRLGIPEYNWWGECLHGVANNGIATVFPQAIAMAATWDPELIHQEADIISTEARAKHADAVLHGQRSIFKGLTFWSPNINIFRDPRWGRGQETYGEDPYLTSRIAVEFVEGLQGNDPKYLKVVSTPKHYAVHSGPEPIRHEFDAEISLTDLYDTYLPAFEACIRKAGAWSVMGAYNSTLGVPCCASDLLLDQILRQRWGFQGYVVSDCGAIRDIYAGHHYARNVAEASALAVKAGCDLSCGGEYGSLVQAVKSGLIAEKEIDESVRRLMMARFKLGMFDPPSMVPYAHITMSMNDTPGHDSLARRVAQESIILLKNADRTLPLSKDIRSIAVIGPYADNVDVLLGNYNGLPSHPVTILQGIRNKVGKTAVVTFAPGAEPLEQSTVLHDIRTEELRPPKGYSGNGVLGEYFDNAELQGKPVLTQIEKTVHHYWDLGSPAPEIPKDHFSARWTGKIVPPASGTYQFGLETDDKGRLFIDGKLVIDNWKPFEINAVKTCELELAGGKAYDFQLDYAEETEYAGIDLRWLRKKDEKSAAKELADAVHAAENSDAVIVVAGISPRLEGEEMSIDIPGFKGGDRTSIDLPEYEETLLRAIQATGKPVILVITNGSALAVNWANDHVAAILEAWYSGQEGGNAVADVLFGDYNPAGRLPVTFYKSVDDLPPFTAYAMKGRTYRYFAGTPLYPFGFGLSYSQFAYGSATIDKPVAGIEDTVTVSIPVTNSSGRDGEEVVQLYVRRADTTSDVPLKSLRGFRRVQLAHGESRTVEIPLAIHDLRAYDEQLHDERVVPGAYQLMIGSSSADIKSHISLQVRAQ